ncbi:MAG: hypothetical protein ACOCX2_00530 [Armatimonadota bacterium]
MVQRGLMLSLLLALCSASGAQDRLLDNPGFEVGEDAPEHWSFNHRTTDGVIAWDNFGAMSAAEDVAGAAAAWWDDARLRVDRATATAFVPRPEAAASLPALEISDGLRLTLSDAVGLPEVLAGESELARAGMPSGLWVQPWRGEMAPVTGELTSAAERVPQTWKDDDLGPPHAAA